MDVEPPIDPEVQILLQYADKELLERTVAALTTPQKKSHLMKQLGEQRYLSALRSGGLANALLTREVFVMDPYFLKSKIVADAARVGLHLQIKLGRLDVAQEIKVAMQLDDEEIPLPEEMHGISESPNE